MIQLLEGMRIFWQAFTADLAAGLWPARSLKRVHADLERKLIDSPPDDPFGLRLIDRNKSSATSPALSDEFQALTENLRLMATAGKISILAQHHETVPYAVPDAGPRPFYTVGNPYPHWYNQDNAGVPAYESMQLITAGYHAELRCETLLNS